MGSRSCIFQRGVEGTRVRHRRHTENLCRRRVVLYLMDCCTACAAFLISVATASGLDR